MTSAVGNDIRTIVSVHFSLRNTSVGASIQKCNLSVSTVAQYATSIMSPRPPSLLSNPYSASPGKNTTEGQEKTFERIRLPLPWTFIPPTIIFVKCFVGTTQSQLILLLP